jgi:2-succinyl-5-enolpyruvyl-6-hydroxy-3-cyclohexene-1-carboxylate synthase
MNAMNGPDLSANVNTHWAAVFMRELALGGLRHICFAPGSRSTPLVLAAAQCRSVQLHRHLDERSAGFYALGLAKATRQPVVLLCTSGTAVANFHPAVIEAYQAQIPLLILSADRPPELRESGANQTIDQLKAFGDHVRLFMEMPLPQSDAPPVTLRHLQTAAARALAAARGPVAGPVHLNFPFRKPLEPVAAERLSEASQTRRTQPYTQFLAGVRQPSPEQIAWLVDVINRESNGLIICGPNCPPESVPAIAQLAEAAGYPVVADVLSGLRFGPHVASAPVLGGYDLLLQAAPEAWPKAQVILRFGDVPTSAALNAYIDRCAAEWTIHVRENGVWSDDLHRVRHFWTANETAVCDAVAQGLGDRPPDRQRDAWIEGFRALEALVWHTQQEQAPGETAYDATVAQIVLAAAGDEGLLLAGNSLSIRHLDAYARPAPQRLTVHGNRGASGIDGNVSTAIGLAAGSGRPVMALIGDVTFYHDMNGLLATRDPGTPPVTFVVVNNNGGGIFRRLPVSVYDPPFTELFLTPHHLTFEHAAAQYGLAHYSFSIGRDDQALRTFFADAGHFGQSSVVEIHTDGTADWVAHRSLIQRIRTAVAARVPMPTAMHSQPSSGTFQANKE